MGHVEKRVLATYSQQRCDTTGTQHALTREGRDTQGHAEEGERGEGMPRGQREPSRLVTAVPVASGPGSESCGGARRQLQGRHLSSCPHARHSSVGPPPWADGSRRDGVLL